MALTVCSIGSAVPEQSLTRDESLEVAKLMAPETKHKTLSKIFCGTGVKKRHSVLLKKGEAEDAAVDYDLLYTPDNVGDPGPTTMERMQVYQDRAHPLAETAVGRALEGSTIRIDDITHLVMVTCSGFFAPGVDIALMKSMGLPHDLERVQVGFMGCQGALNGLRVANGLAGTRSDACVLLCAVELCSVHFHYGWQVDRAVANALFADGSAALVGQSDGSGWKVRANGACLVPESEGAMSWRIGDHGFEMGLSSALPRIIEANLRPWLADWLNQHGLTIDDVATWAVHPGGPSIVRSVQKGLGLADDALDVSLGVLQELGNMSSPTILFILERLLAADAELPCVGLAFGPGLSVEAVLFDE